MGRANPNDQCFRCGLLRSAYVHRRPFSGTDHEFQEYGPDGPWQRIVPRDLPEPGIESEIARRVREEDAARPRAFLNGPRPLLTNRSIYVIGSLRNPNIPIIGNKLREAGWDVYDDWYAGGPEADDYWKKYEQGRGHTFIEALAGHTAHNIFHFDKHHIDRCGMGLLVCPAGKSGHLELGAGFIGAGKPGYILLDNDPERFDVMYRYAHGVFADVDAFLETVTYP